MPLPVPLPEVTLIHWLLLWAFQEQVEPVVTVVEPFPPEPEND
jgi:hypothetical protein